MAKRQKPKAERDRIARWEQIVSAYQRRHRQWVMEGMPRMSNADWDMYMRWVAGFGAMSLNQAYRNSRKMRRRLTAAKNVTVTVREECPNLLPTFQSELNKRMRFAMEMTLGGKSRTIIQVARAGGKTATVSRATRR